MSAPAVRCWGVVLVMAVGTVASAATIVVPGDQPTIAAAMQVAVAGDTVLVTDQTFRDELLIDWLGKAVTLRTASDAHQRDGGVCRMSPGGMLRGGTTYLGTVTIVGELRSGTSGAADVIGNSFIANQTSQVTVLPGAELSIRSMQSFSLGGHVVVREDGILSLLGNQSDVFQDGDVSMAEGSQLIVNPRLVSQGMLVGTDATLRLGGGMCQNNAQWFLSGGSLELTGEFQNEGRVIADEVEAMLGPGFQNRRELRFFDASIMAADILSQDAELGLYNTTLMGTSLANYGFGAHLIGDGLWVVDLTNTGVVDILHDTTIIGTVQNDGFIVVHDGTLTIVGSLFGEGTIVGQYTGRGEEAGLDQLRTAPARLRVDGALVAGTSAGLWMPSPQAEVRVSGNCDLAISDHTRFDLAQATLTVGVLSGPATSLEVMSADLGPDPAGLDRQRPGHYPIGTLYLAGGAVVLVDQHPNQPPGTECTEAVYVHTLHVGPGATLNTNGYRVYYETLVNEGTIDEPQNVQPIVAVCHGDCNCDHTVGFADIDLFVASLPDNWEAWRSKFNQYYGRLPDCPFSNADVDGDGHVGFGDIDGFVRLIPSACE